MKSFTDRQIDEIKKKKSILIVGLDPQLQYFPESIRIIADGGYVGAALYLFNKGIIDAVEPFVVAVKPQMAFYERFGSIGVKAFEDTVSYAKGKGLIVIEDAKRGDGGDTAEAYAIGHLYPDDAYGFDVDCITINVWIGDSCIAPFIDMIDGTGKGIFVVTKTSFKPNSRVENIITQKGIKIWEELAEMVGEWGKGTEGEYGYKNIGVVMGATYPEDAVRMRQILPNSFFLVPGYGAQGGGADNAVKGVNKDGLGCIVSSSRGIIYAYQKGRFQCDGRDFAKAAEEAAKFSRDELNTALERAGKIFW